jgi:hypothetical protein
MIPSLTLKIFPFLPFFISLPHHRPWRNCGVHPESARQDAESLTPMDGG